MLGGMGKIWRGDREEGDMSGRRLLDPNHMGSCFEAAIANTEEVTPNT